jgi:hypothetical protein
MEYTIVDPETNEVLQIPACLRHSRSPHLLQDVKNYKSRPRQPMEIELLIGRIEAVAQWCRDNGLVKVAKKLDATLK